MVAGIDDTTNENTDARIDDLSLFASLTGDLIDSAEADQLDAPELDAAQYQPAPLVPNDPEKTDMTAEDVDRFFNYDYYRSLTNKHTVNDESTDGSEPVVITSIPVDPDLSRPASDTLLALEQTKLLPESIAPTSFTDGLEELFSLDLEQPSPERDINSSTTSLHQMYPPLASENTFHQQANHLFPLSLDVAAGPGTTGFLSQQFSHLQKPTGIMPLTRPFITEEQPNVTTKHVANQKPASNSMHMAKEESQYSDSERIKKKLRL
ncbi:MAG: hypothetical protein HOI53_07685 [Francisellaceae bacterium]|jgi:hypothetical protein|nr:hypothetical protein [Francisellaceae bacterium]MBT6207894.1 hypothetical protein [Francisellaceae bacterium]